MKARIHSKGHLFAHTRGRFTLSSITVACILLLLLSTFCFAGVRWTANGITVCTAAGLQEGPQIASDGAGGAIIVWLDHRAGAGRIYAQRLNSSGTPLWNSGGVLIDGTGYGNLYPQIISDGAKGAIITWDHYDGYSRYIRAQRLNSSGSKLWGSGVNAAYGGHYEIPPESEGPPPAEWGSRITTDGWNGVFITWMINKGSSSAPQYDVYVTRLKADGSHAWGDLHYHREISIDASNESCVQITTNPTNPQASGKDAYGAIITWARAYSALDNDIYCRAVDSDGYLWNTYGISLSGYNDMYPMIAPITGGGGAIITWMRNDNVWKVCARSVMALTGPPWTEQVVASGGSGYHMFPTITTDGTLVSYGGGSYETTGAIITWMRYDTTPTPSWNIYARRVLWDKSMPWTAKAISIHASQESSPQIAYVGWGGAMITWLLNRGSDNAPQFDIYARKIQASGSIPWSTQTISNSGYNEGVQKITSDGARGAIITWQRAAPGDADNIYAQRVSNPAPSITSISPTSGRRGSKLTIYGRNFDPPRGSGCVVFGRTKAAVYSWTSTRIVAKVPNVAYGRQYVRVCGYGGASNAKIFTVKR